MKTIASSKSINMAIEALMREIRQYQLAVEAERGEAVLTREHEEALKKLRYLRYHHLDKDWLPTTQARLQKLMSIRREGC